MKTALIIIDVQNILVETGFETEKLLEKIAYLQDRARKQQIEIIYMQHIETPEALTLEDWQLSPLLKRRPRVAQVVVGQHRVVVGFLNAKYRHISTSFRRS